MARQWTAKQAIDSQSQLVSKPANVVTQEQRDMLAKANAPIAPTWPGNVSKPLSNVVDTMPLNPTPINTPAPVAPRVEGQWNYGTNEEQVLGEKPTVAPTQPTPTVKPASASQAIAQGFKQEIKPVAKGANAPLTTEIGREAKLGQLPTVQQAQNQAEQDRINTANLKSASGQQLWSNLETISGANQSLLNDRKAFDQAFGYDNKDVSEKALVDAFWKSKRLDANSIYGAISTGATIPNESKNTPAFTDALIRHQDTTRFENLNPYQLSKVINTELIPWTQTYADLMAKNPQLVTDAMKLASINAPVTARQETTNWQDNLSNYLSRSPVMSNPTTVATIMNSDPNIATKTNEVQAVEDKLTEAKDRLKNIQKNVTERYKGTGATKQTVNAKALAESQDIIDEITMLEANKASASSALTTLIQNAKDNYTYARQDRLDAQAQYDKWFEQLTAMAKMGMDQDNEQYKRQQDATTRDLQLLMHYDEQDQANAREQRGYDFQMKRDEQNFGQQKELAKMGYNQAERMSSINYNQDINKLRLTNDLQTNQDLQTRVMDMRQQGYSDQDIQNIIYGGGTQQTNVGDYIKSKEWFRDKAYLDSAGVPTIGYGFTSVNGKPVKMGDTMDRATADSEFNTQIQKYQNFQNLVTVPLSESQKAALTSFEYNLGGWIWKKDAMPIITAINNGDLSKAGQLMQQYNKAGGKFVQGLANRRNEEAKLLQQWGGQNTQTSTTYSTPDIAVYNSLTPSDTKKSQNNPLFRKFIEDKNVIMSNPDAPINDVLKYSQGGKDLDATRVQSLAKFGQSLEQISNLQKNIKKEDTGPIIGAIRSYNPYDSNAQSLKAQLNSLIPNLARGVYGEVGVLTDNDIANYQKTVPSLKSTADTNKLVLAMTMKAIQNGFKSQLQTEAASGRDVSQFGGLLKQYDNKVNWLLWELWVQVDNTVKVNSPVYDATKAQLEKIKAERLKANK